MTTGSKIMAVIGMVALNCSQTYSQVNFYRADSVIDFLIGNWTWQRYCDGWNGCYTEFDSHRLFCFDTVQGSDDSIAFQCFRADTLFYALHYYVSYIPVRMYHNDYFWTLLSSFDAWLFDFYTSDSIRMRQMAYDGADIILKRGGTISRDKIISREELRIYPNPCDDYIVCEVDEKGSSTVRIFNSKGQCMKGMVLSNEYRCTINTSDFPAGVYYVVAITNHKIRLCKLLKA